MSVSVSHHYIALQYRWLSHTPLEKSIFKTNIFFTHKAGKPWSLSATPQCSTALMPVMVQTVTIQKQLNFPPRVESSWTFSKHLNSDYRFLWLEKGSCLPEWKIRFGVNLNAHPESFLHLCAPLLPDIQRRRTPTELASALTIKQNHTMERAHWCLSWDVSTGEEWSVVKLSMAEL